MDKLVELLHDILRLLPWRTEADFLAAKDKADALVADAQTTTDTNPVGRNATPSGVVTGGPNTTPEPDVEVKD